MPRDSLSSRDQGTGEIGRHLSVSDAGGFRSDIEGLRAVAIALVFADHLVGWPRGGFIGVDVFFVISGYLITQMLLAERPGHRRLSLREFYARRARRILPAALTVLVITAIAARVAFIASRAHDTFVDALWAAIFGANIHFAAVGTDYFKGSGLPSPIEHYWSLSVEEQFYLVWPCLALGLAWLVRRRRTADGRRVNLAVGLVAVVASVISFEWGLHALAASPTAAYFSAPARAWELGVGCAVASFQPFLGRIGVGLRVVMAWLGLTGIAASALLTDSITAFPGRAALLPILATAMLLVAGNPRTGVGARWALGWRPVQWLGRLSYSLYLWHWPCIVFAAAFFPTTRIRYYLAALVLPVVLSVVSLHAIENPVRRSRWLSARPHDTRRHTPRAWYVAHARELQRFGASAVIVAVLMTVWAAASPTGSFGVAAKPFALPADQHGTEALVRSLQGDLREALRLRVLGPTNPSVDSLLDAKVPQWQTCGSVSDDEALARCTFGSASAARTAVVVGDSFALSYLPGIIAALTPHNWRVVAMTYGECPNVLASVTQRSTGSPRPFEGCASHHALVEAEVQELHPDLVILSDASHLVEELIGDPADPYQIWLDSASSYLERLHVAGGREVVLSAPPGSGNLMDCIVGSRSLGRCNLSISSQWEQVGAAERAAAERVGARYVDVRDWFCWRSQCPAVIGPTPVYWDGDHLTAAYAIAIAPLLRNALTR